MAAMELASPDGSGPLHVMLPAAVASSTACPGMQLVVLCRLQQQAITVTGHAAASP